MPPKSEDDSRKGVKIAEAMSAAVFPHWHIVPDDGRVKGAVAIFTFSVLVALWARFLGPASVWDAGYLQVARAIASIVPPALAILVGLFSLKSAAARWQRFIIFGAAAWLLTVIWTFFCLLAARQGADIFQWLYELQFREWLAYSIVIAVGAALSLGILYSRFWWRDLRGKPVSERRRDPTGVVFLTFIFSVVLFTFGAWLAIFSDFNLI